VKHLEKTVKLAIFFKLINHFCQRGTITLLPPPQLQTHCHAAISKAFDWFLQQYPQYNEVVVKPSGIRYFIMHRLFLENIWTSLPSLSLS
jgi:hypothetical protein